MTSTKFLRLLSNFSIAAAIIMIWRGLWYLLDIVDATFFGGVHIWTSLAGIIIGIIILYIPDHNLDELGKL
jgi:hypothetical protein